MPASTSPTMSPDRTGSISPAMSSSKIVRPDKRTKQRRAIMPFIQCDLEVGLSDKEKTALVRKMTEVTHRAIGSAYGHINVVLREH